MEIRQPDFLKPKIENKDLVIFTRQFATMIDSGLPLVQCLEIQAAQCPTQPCESSLRWSRNRGESGTTFAESLKKFPDTFDELFCNLVAAGEIGGILDTILNRLAVFMEKNDKLRRQIKGAMTYPVVVLFVAVIVTAVCCSRWSRPLTKCSRTLVGPCLLQRRLSSTCRIGCRPTECICSAVLLPFGFKMLIQTEKGRYGWHAFC